MKNHLRKCLLAATLLSLAAAALAADDSYKKPVQVNLEKVPHYLRPTILEKAAKGERELTRYIQFTRRFHGLLVEDVLLTDADGKARLVVEASAPSVDKVADRTEAVK